MTIMRAIKTEGWCADTQLVVGTATAPIPGENDVLAKVCAASVNPKDWKVNLSLAKAATPLGTRWLPPLFGDDMAGVVIGTGSKVTDFKEGDAVYGMDMRLRTASLAEFAVIDQRRIAHKPKSLAFTEAAAVPLAGLTALQGMRKGGATAGSDVLIIGASGGVGTFTVQVAKAIGCRVTAVCSSRNAEMVHTLGADEVIDYTAGDYRHGPARFDVVFDVTSYETFGSCERLLKPEGTFISTGGNGRAVLSSVLTRGKRSQIILVESWRQDLETLAKWIDGSQVHVVLDSVFPLAQTQEAYDRSRSGRARGKIVVEV